MPEFRLFTGQSPSQSCRVEQDARKRVKMITPTKRATLGLSGHPRCMSLRSGAVCLVRVGPCAHDNDVLAQSHPDVLCGFSADLYQ
jgi:hypothetical protein